MIEAHNPDAARPVGDAQPPEARLWTNLKRGGDQAAREQLFTLYAPFAQKIARRHHLAGAADIEFQDLSQLASAGLLEAIDRFDPDNGAPFRGYARRRIAGSITDGIAKLNEVREQIAFRNRTRRERLRSLAVEDGGAKGGRDAMDSLIELAVGLAIGFMLDDAAATQPEAAADRSANAYESLAWKESLRHLLEEVTNLPERERTIIRQHYLEGLDFEHIATQLNLSKGRVSQLHKAALGVLRRRLRGAHDFVLQR